MNGKIRKTLGYSLATAVFLATGTASVAEESKQSAGKIGGENLMELAADPANWVMWGGNYTGQRYSKLDQINAENVAQLQPTWTFSTGVLRGHEGGPLVLDGTMYIHTPFPNNVFAIDLKTQGIKWKYSPTQDPSVIPVMCCDTVNRGLAYAEGKIFLQQADTTLVALDAESGEVLWQTINGDPSKAETNTNAPLVIGNKIITGISGGEFGVRGYTSAYDINDGKLIWRAYSTGPDETMLIDPEKTIDVATGEPVGKDSSLKSWEGDQWKIGGGTTWGWFTYDPDLNLLYYGTGNPGTWNPDQRPGDNKWSMTIFARDADTGMAKWAYQMTPHDEWDYDGVNEKILVDQEIDGEMTPLVVHFDRNGFGYTQNRETGKLLKVAKYDPAVNWASEIDMETGRPVLNEEYGTSGKVEENVTGICPAALGSKDQQPAAFSPKTGLFYVPTNHVCMDYEPNEVAYTAGQPYVGATLSMYPGPGDITNPVKEIEGERMGTFIAWDATTAEIKWSIPERFSVWSGALATAGDVVFYGTLEGHLKAIDAKTGELLYSFKTPSGIIGNVNTWSFEDKQYIGVLSGIGGWAGIGMAAGLEDPTAGLGAVGGYKDLQNYTQLGGVLTVFALPDSALEGQMVGQK
ncbi:methanol/ethanol family PQQ-dependent dehydrogenase [Marinobacter changyiensis]|uniref:methanol/ethanol family PQQ-dependent dehydrogenase n=1 Tax=Marinobacter changyiensis TaxID=2604091 RepID=UPI0012642D4C|nr:methanol/ethanol family PQQ-dependent dehydrogenase [Marinobacter changyiensis]